MSAQLYQAQATATTMNTFTSTTSTTGQTTWVALTNGTIVNCPITTATPAWAPPYTPDITIHDGGPERTISFPDGTVIDVKSDGSFQINDADAKVTYRANRVRDFNPYINASDKLEAFIKFCGEIGVSQGQVLDIPIKHFIGWLIVEAARADGEDANQLAAQLKTDLVPA